MSDEQPAYTVYSGQYGAWLWRCESCPTGGGPCRTEDEARSYADTHLLACTDAARARLASFLDWWPLQYGDVIGSWSETLHDENEQPGPSIDGQRQLLASDLRLLVGKDRSSDG